MVAWHVSGIAVSEIEPCLAEDVTCTHLLAPPYHSWPSSPSIVTPACLLVQVEICGEVRAFTCRAFLREPAVLPERVVRPAAEAESWKWLAAAEPFPGANLSDTVTHSAVPAASRDLESRLRVIRTRHARSSLASCMPSELPRPSLQAQLTASRSASIGRPMVPASMISATLSSPFAPSTPRPARVLGPCGLVSAGSRLSRLSTAGIAATNAGQNGTWHRAQSKIRRSGWLVVTLSLIPDCRLTLAHFCSLVQQPHPHISPVHLQILAHSTLTGVGSGLIEGFSRQYHHLHLLSSFGPAVWAGAARGSFAAGVHSRSRIFTPTNLCGNLGRTAAPAPPNYPYRSSHVGRSIGMRAYGRRRQLQPPTPATESPTLQKIQMILEYLPAEHFPTCKQHSPRLPERTSCRTLLGRLRLISQPNVVTRLILLHLLLLCLQLVVELRAHRLSSPQM